jgi:signal peptidase I
MENDPNRELLATPPPQPYKRKIWVTVLLSLFSPGLPLIYAGNLKGGIILIIILELIDIPFNMMAGLSLLSMLLAFTISFIIYVLLLIYNINYIRKANRFDYPRLPNARRWILSIIIGLLVLGIAESLITHAFIYQSYKVPSGSMANTLLPDDYLTAAKRINVNDLHRGDIIIFKFPPDHSQSYIKRLVAIGGDRIKIVDKRLFVNDSLVSLPLEAESTDSARIFPHTFDGSWKKSAEGSYWESSGNRDNMPELTVPSGQFFVMGDNRDNSADSRYWGFLDSKLVVGRARFIHFSWDSHNHRIRWERIGKRLG